MTRHELIQPDTQHYACSVCGQTWQARPRSQCPGLKLYPKYGHEPLLTKLQLGYVGYEISAKALPPPVGCCRSNGKYQMLYDPAQAIKKQKNTRERVTISVTELYWPLKCIPFIDAYLRHDSFSRQNELADIAFHVSPFTAPEVRQWAGEYLHLVIDPCLIHVSYPAFQRSSTQQAVLVKSIIAAYKKHKAKVEAAL